MTRPFLLLTYIFPLGTTFATESYAIDIERGGAYAEGATEDRLLLHAKGGEITLRGWVGREKRLVQKGVGAHEYKEPNDEPLVGFTPFLPRTSKTATEDAALALRAKLALVPPVEGETD